MPSWASRFGISADRVKSVARPRLLITWFALLRALGFLAVLPLIPFVFVWAFLVELFRPKHQPPAPIQSATQRTAEVIDLAAWRRRKGKAKE